MSEQHQRTANESDVMVDSNLSRFFAKEGSSQFEQIFARRYSSRDKLIMGSKTKLEIPRVKRSKKEFPTGSSYIGEWDIFGMSGNGRYNFPYEDVVYEGEFMEGMFHGNGKMIYPTGITLRGIWERGELQEYTVVFPDNIEYKPKDWKYCTMPDRRFSIEYEKGLQPASQTFMTNKEQQRKIPKGYYDTVEGFYDPITKVVFKPNDPTRILRVPIKLERDWIEANCRKEWKEVVGPRPDLYEKWDTPVIQRPKDRNLNGKAFSFEQCEAFKVSDTDIESPCLCSPCELGESQHKGDNNVQTNKINFELDKMTKVTENHDKSIENQYFQNEVNVYANISEIPKSVCAINSTESEPGQTNPWQKIFYSKSGEVFRNVMHGTMSSLEDKRELVSYKKYLNPEDLLDCKLCFQKDTKDEAEN